MRKAREAAAKAASMNGDDFARTFKMPSKEELEEMRRGAELLSTKLAKHGWPLPMDMAPAEAWQIAERQDPKEFDAAFVDHYTLSGGRYLDEMVKRLAGSKPGRPTAHAPGRETNSVPSP